MLHQIETRDRDRDDLVFNVDVVIPSSKPSSESKLEASLTPSITNSASHDIAHIETHYSIAS